MFYFADAGKQVDSLSLKDDWFKAIAKTGKYISYLEPDKLMFATPLYIGTKIDDFPFNVYLCPMVPLQQSIYDKLNEANEKSFKKDRNLQYIQLMVYPYMDLKTNTIVGTDNLDQFKNNIRDIYHSSESKRYKSAYEKQLCNIIGSTETNTNINPAFSNSTIKYQYIYNTDNYPTKVTSSNPGSSTVEYTY